MLLRMETDYPNNIADELWDKEIPYNSNILPESSSYLGYQCMVTLDEHTVTSIHTNSAHSIELQAKSYLLLWNPCRPTTETLLVTCF